jgi:hypothetical protein
MLVIIGTEEYLKEISPLDRIVKKLNDEQWVQELNAFDIGMCLYLPKDSNKYLTSLDKLH